MRQPKYSEEWPESWKTSFPYDLIEVYGERPPRTRGYAFHYDMRRAHALAAVKRHMPPGARVLDVAAAQGNFTLALAEAGYRVSWNDLRGELADYVKLKHEYGDVEYIVGNCFELDLPQKFDVVFATEIIEHVAHPDLFVKQLKNLVSDEGYIIITTPNGSYFNNRLPRFSDCPDPSMFESMQFKPNSDGHIFLIYPDEIRRFARDAGLEVVELRTFTSFVANGYLGWNRIIGRVPEGFVSRLDWVLGKTGRISKKLHTGTIAVLRRPAATIRSRSVP